MDDDKFFLKISQSVGIRSCLTFLEHGDVLGYAPEYCAHCMPPRISMRVGVDSEQLHTECVRERMCANMFVR